MMVTRRGTVKKTELTAFKPPLGRGIIALGLDEGDQLIGVARTKAGDQVVLSTQRRAWRSGSTSPTSARWAARRYGVRGINLEEGDEVVGMVVANGDDDPASLLTVCANGYGKRTVLTEYRSQNRGGKGLIDIKTSDRNGPVVAIAKVTDADEVMLTTTGGILIRTRVADIRPIGRNTQGVRLIRVEEGDTVSSLAKLPEEELTAGRRRSRPPTADARRPAGDGHAAPHPRRRRRPRPRPATTWMWRPRKARRRGEAGGTTSPTAGCERPRPEPLSVRVCP